MSQGVLVWVIAVCAALCVCALVVEAWVGISLRLAISPALKKYAQLNNDVKQVIHVTQRQLQQAKPRVMENSSRVSSLVKMEMQTFSEDRAEISRIISSVRRMIIRVRTLSLGGSSLCVKVDPVRPSAPQEIN
jgi:predicted XRE-type DNA-binding protein